MKQDGKNRGRILTITAIALLLLHFLYLIPAAAEGHAGSRIIEYDLSKGNFPSNEAMAESFLYRAFYGEGGRMTKGGTAGSALTGTNKKFYDVMKPLIEKVARGEETSSIFTINSMDIFEKTSFTFAEVGLEPDADEETIYTTVDQFIQPAYRCFEALFYDCPYDYYWVDRNYIIQYNPWYDYSYPTENVTDQSLITVEPGNIEVVYIVASEFREGGDYYTVNNDFAETVSYAKARANSIVEANAGKTDVEKLTAYKRAICDLVDYNYDVLDENYSDGYGNPWQLLWVFDDDPATNVVCEGYSKAFQYLSELTTSFLNTGVKVISVGGMWYGTYDSGLHMWNIVTLGGKKYLADITHSDDGSPGGSDDVFLVGYTGKTLLEDGRTQYDFEKGGSYVFVEEVVDLFAAEELELGDRDYMRYVNPERSTVFREANILSGSTEAVSLPGGWYAAVGTVSYPAGLTFTGDTNLILANGCSLKVENSSGSALTVNGSLTVYSQTDGKGTLTAEGAVNGIDSTSVTVIGGKISACGTSGAGILGSVVLNHTSVRNSIYVSRYGGTVTVADGKHFIDENKELYTGTLTKAQITAVAMKTLIPAYVVTYNANGGYFSDENLTTVYRILALTGETFTTPGDMIFAGHHFCGWKNGDQKFDFSKPITGDLTLDAWWESNGLSVDPMPDREYTGQNSSPTVTVKDGYTGDPLTEGTHYSIAWEKDGRSVSEVVNAGVYVMTVTGVGDYADAPTQTATYTITPIDVTLTAGSGTETYDGTKKTVSGFTSSVSGLTFPGVSAGGSGTDAATYAVSFTGVEVGKTLDSTGNYQVSAVETGMLTILPKSITGATVTLDKTQLSWSGTEQSVSVTGVAIDGLALAAKDYTVSNHSGTDLGEYTVTVTGTGNFCDTATAVWKIVEKAMTVSTENVNLAYDGQPHGITVTVTDPAGGATVKYGTSSGDYPLDASPTITDAGTLTVYYQITAANYEDYTGAAIVTVTKTDTALETRPEDMTTLVWTGEAMPLIAVVTVTGGEVWYALGSYTKAASVPPTTGWTREVPMATAPGTYEVWYKIIGDANHLDSEPVCVTVIVGPTSRPAPGGKLRPVLKSAGKTSLELSWTKMKNVDGYDVFMARCNTEDYRLVKSVSAKKDACRIEGLKKGIAYKVYIKAYVLQDDGTKTYGSKSMVVHSYTNQGNGKETNPKNIRLKTKEITVSVGSTADISAKLIGEVSDLPVLDHFGAFKYESGDEKIATVTEEGKVTGKAEGSCKIRVIACNGISRTVTVTVAPKLTSISFPKKEYSMKKGKTLDLAAKLKRTPAGATAKFTWESSDEEVATVSKDGIVTALKKGTATITVTVKSNKALKAKVKIRVAKK